MLQVRGNVLLKVFTNSQMPGLAGVSFGAVPSGKRSLHLWWPWLYLSLLRSFLGCFLARCLSVTCTFNLAFSLILSLLVSLCLCLRLGCTFLGLFLGLCFCLGFALSLLSLSLSLSSAFCFGLPLGLWLCEGAKLVQPGNVNLRVKKNERQKARK